MSKHRDHGTVQKVPFAYVGDGGDLYRVGYPPFGRVYRAEFSLDNRSVTGGEFWHGEEI